MSNDRELLELAAKAVGLHPDEAMWHSRAGFVWVRRADGIRTENSWNPLTDDGDALRLAVKTGEPFVVRTRCVTTMGGLQEDFDPSISGDDLRAVRRIIVRAAANKGKSIP